VIWWSREAERSILAGNDFDVMDQEAGMVPRSSSPVDPLPSDVLEYRSQLIAEYHNGAKSLVKRLEEEGKGDDIESLVLALINEVIQESEHLLGNQLVEAKNGDLRAASVISFKRAEVLEKALKAVQTKLQFEREGGGLDIDSPAMMTVFRFFMEKVREVFGRIGMEEEVSDLFFRTLGEHMENWKKELRVRFEDLKARK